MPELKSCQFSSGQFSWADVNVAVCVLQTGCRWRNASCCCCCCCCCHRQFDILHHYAISAAVDTAPASAPSLVGLNRRASPTDRFFCRQFAAKWMCVGRQYCCVALRHRRKHAATSLQLLCGALGFCLNGSHIVSYTHKVAFTYESSSFNQR